MDKLIYETPGVTLFVSDGYVSIWDTWYNIICEWLIRRYMRYLV